MVKLAVPKAEWRSPTFSAPPVRILGLVILLADEPTGELDSSTDQDVFSALQTANTELGATVLVVTHDPAVSSQHRRTIAIRDGRTSSETIRRAGFSSCAR